VIIYGRIWVIAEDLFKEPLPKNGSLARPNWVEDALRTNPQETFWQYHFEPEGTKGKRGVHAIFPRVLVPLLEEYLQIHRPLLVRGNDPGTLFLSCVGKQLAPESMDQIIGNITYRYTNHQVNPHLLRDIFTVGWL